ncbi:nucleotide-binding universal stress UspA family protein [Kushneria sinocarnis]|uniref:Nucleotide-binding universal stress UspA family protein n=1 Tax=Kushneria sinocarnis TaxID=595502 RepID=A0A420X1J7_9GAMM|nr:universal stress protein [Kushneria sinocarnis]RKR07620.1 nucleotide-binding universal stress UspA family protein [Kushneria sinocarnis]
MFRSLLVPIDGSGYARQALRVACELAASHEATLYLLNVRELLPHLHDGGIRSVEQALRAASAQAVEEAGQALLDRALAEVPDFPGEIRTLVRRGSPAHVIIHEAKTLGVDAIVMGSRGLSDLTGMAIGSVSHRVSHTAHCMVISVHAAEDATP